MIYVELAFLQKQIFEKYDLKSQIYKRFKADSSRICKQSQTIEYLHILEKN
ncbi:hypothetical protein [Campylobacter coli]|uniref:hypothetical protein n=1 Tax=Campylobacter coli TaxID=195 RepID=UPI000B33C5AF|nr:hypothetical protein [Campylobacter coli]EEU7949833.1 hypothetical protein [Campylobacter coli]